MYNWSIDEKRFRKEHPEKYKIWRLEQLINFGLGDEKLDLKELKKYWNVLDIDKTARKYLEFLLWPTHQIRS